MKTIQLQGNSYAKVADRIKQFREECPNGSIETEQTTLPDGQMILKAINSYYYSHPVSYSIIELRNIATVADLIVRSASRRKESRVLHYILDYPERDDDKWKRDTIIRPPHYISRNRRKK